MTTAKTEESAEPERPAPINVIQALARIMEELPAIGKTKKPSADGERGVTYAYRGIEEITAEAQGLFAKYGVVVIPQTTVPLETREFQTQKGTTWTDEKIEIHWRIYGPGGTEDWIEAQTLGIGRDNSDKGFNKGATQALKYLLLPMLLVADPKDDADGKTQENDGGEKKTTTRKPPARRSPVPDGAPTASHADTDGDIATMDLRTLTAALKAAGLELTGTSEQKRLRLQEHRSGVAPAKTAAPSEPAKPQASANGKASEKALGYMNSFFTGYERAERLAAISDLVGYDLESTTTLTAAEVSNVIKIMKGDE